MQPGSTKITLKIKRDQNGTHGSTLPDLQENANQNAEDLPSSDEEESFSTDGEGNHSQEIAEQQLVDGEENHSQDNAEQQLVVYEPSTNGGGVAEPGLDSQLVSLPKGNTHKGVPSVGTFTVQCAKCFQWRVIPTKEKYEEIREHILEEPFYCDTAIEWRPDISCNDPPDICQDGSRVWAIDKPNIAQPPPGWQRLLSIRGEGSTRFADVYYVAPTGKKLRSSVEVQKYLEKNPEYFAAGVEVSKFSFQTPKPLRENYVRKRTKSIQPDHSGFLEFPLVNPIASAGPDAGLSAPFFESPSSESTNRAKKRVKRPINACTSSIIVSDDQETAKMVDPSPIVTVDETSQPAQVEELSEHVNGGTDQH